MANYGYKQYNYSNVSTYRQTLESNRNKMEDLFRKYQGELSNIETNWIGSSGSVSQSNMQELIQKYNGFLDKVNSFITILSAAEREFIDTESQNISTYK